MKKPPEQLSWNVIVCAVFKNQLTIFFRMALTGALKLSE